MHDAAHRPGDLRALGLGDLHELLVARDAAAPVVDAALATSAICRGSCAHSRKACRVSSASATPSAPCASWLTGAATGADCRGENELRIARGYQKESGPVRLRSGGCDLCDPDARALHGTTRAAGRGHRSRLNAQSVHVRVLGGRFKKERAVCPPSATTHRCRCPRSFRCQTARRRRPTMASSRTSAARWPCRRGILCHSEIISRRFWSLTRMRFALAMHERTALAVVAVATSLSSTRAPPPRR